MRHWVRPARLMAGQNWKFSNFNFIITLALSSSTIFDQADWPVWRFHLVDCLLCTPLPYSPFPPPHSRPSHGLLIIPFLFRFLKLNQFFFATKDFVLVSGEPMVLANRYYYEATVVDSISTRRLFDKFIVDKNTICQSGIRNGDSDIVCDISSLCSSERAHTPE